LAKRKHGTSIALVVGSELPLRQVVYDPAGDEPGLSWFSLIFDDAPPPEEVDVLEPACLHCVIEEYGAEVAVPLDLAVKHRCSVMLGEDGVWGPDPDYFEPEA
jgi:hypothetical protein